MIGCRRMKGRRQGLRRGASREQAQGSTAFLLWAEAETPGRFPIDDSAGPEVNVAAPTGLAACDWASAQGRL